MVVERRSLVSDVWFDLLKLCCLAFLAMKIAVEGCAHGELDMIYSSLENIQQRDNIKVDLLLCCGDFQAVRNEMDLQCMAVPAKYRKMCSFYKYYSGEKRAPILTLFIGGNHEASNHLWELPFGGWVAPNIYYLGYSGVVNFGGLRIAGLSGIYKHHDYNKGHFESPPFNNNTMRSIYHVRSLDTFKLKLLSNPVNIVMSHDWPKGVYHYGNLDELYRWKGFLRQEIEENTLGSSAAEDVLRSLQPDHWFSAHLHVRFPARIQHSQTSKVTNFLALDKCLPKRKFLEVIDVGPASGPLELSYDAEWLAITKLTLPFVNTEPSHTQLPLSREEITKCKPTQDTIRELSDLMGNDLRIPHNFTQNAPLYDAANHQRFVRVTTSTNPQTDFFCQRLKMRNPFWETDLLEGTLTENPDEINLSDEDEEMKNYNSSTFSLNLPEPTEKKESGKETGLISNAASDQSENVSYSTSDEAEKNTFSEKEGDSSTASKSVFEEKESVEDSTSSEQDKDVSSSGYEPPTKTFKLKRRNQAIYTASEDSDS